MTRMRGIYSAMLVSVVMGIVAPDVAASCRVLDPELQGLYNGPCVDGLAQDEGVAVGAARYSGAFNAGRKHGKGLKEWPGGERYEGGFANDLKHGQGTYVWGAQSQWARQRYTGSFVNDRRHGEGTYEWPDGRRLAGRWVDDQPVTLSPAMQRTVRAHAERMVVFSKPGATVCRNIPVGIAQIDVIGGVVQSLDGDRLRIRIQRLGKFSKMLDGRAIDIGSEIVEDSDHWFPCLLESVRDSGRSADKS